MILSYMCNFAIHDLESLSLQEVWYFNQLHYESIQLYTLTTQPVNEVGDHKADDGKRAKGARKVDKAETVTPPTTQAR